MLILGGIIQNMKSSDWMKNVKVEEHRHLNL